MTAQHRKEALAGALAMQWAADETFRRALLRLYRTHCRDLPAGPGAAVPDPLRDAIAAHYGRPVTTPSTRPAFARMTLADIERLTAGADVDAAQWAGAYLAALARLARSYGLDRWQPAMPRSYGEILVHKWCTLRAGYGLGPRRFADAVGSLSGWVPRRALQPDARRMPVPSWPLAWDPRQEPYAAARTRLRSAVDAELKAIRDEWQAVAGFAFRLPPSTDRDARWLFQRLRGRPCAAIAGAELPKEDPDTAAAQVQQATHRLAEMLQVEFR
jgi:hypothetical protein